MQFTAKPIYAAGNSLRVITLAFSIFSMKMPYPVVGFATITCVTVPTSLPFYDNQAKPSLCLHKRASADCSAVARKRRAECIAPSGNACTAKEYNLAVGHECVQVGTTKFNGNFIKFIVLG